VQQALSGITHWYSTFTSAFFILFIQLKKPTNPNSSTSPSHEKQEKYIPRDKIQMKDDCFQRHHGKWKPRELPSLRKAVEVSSPKNSTSRRSQIGDLWASWKFSTVWLELLCSVLSAGGICSSFLQISVSSSQLCPSSLFLYYLYPACSLPHKLPFHFFLQ